MSICQDCKKPLPCPCDEAMRAGLVPVRKGKGALPVKPHRNRKKYHRPSEKKQENDQ